MQSANILGEKFIETTELLDNSDATLIIFS